jgi:hypothetical protein
MKSEYYRKKLTKKWVKKRVFYGKGILGFFGIFKIKNGNTHDEKKNQK